MAKKNVPYDQEYYDKEIEPCRASSLRNCSSATPKDELMFCLRELSLLQTRLG